MSIISYVSAHWFHSSDAAFKLAERKPEKYLSFAKKLISIKKEHILNNAPGNNATYNEAFIFFAREKKYNYLLTKLAALKKKSEYQDRLLNYTPNLPRLIYVPIDRTHATYPRFEWNLNICQADNRNIRLPRVNVT